MPTLAARLMIAVAALSMLPICLASPAATAAWLRGFDGVAQNRPALVAFEPGHAIDLPRPKRLRHSVRGRDGVWSTPE